MPVDATQSLISHFPEDGFNPAAFLVENIGLLPRGKALDLAMGGGRNAVYLARNGFEVEGVDISPDAVRAATYLAARYNVKIKTRTADLEKDFQIEPAAYDLIICFNYLRRSLIPAIKGGIRQPGMVVYETFIVDQARFGKPKNPDFLLGHNELLDMFRDFRCLRYREGVFEDRALASIVAQKV